MFGWNTSGARKEVSAFSERQCELSHSGNGAVSEAAGGCAGAGEAVLKPVVKAEGSTTLEQQSCFQQVSLSLLLQPLRCILFGKHNRCQRQGSRAPHSHSPTLLLVAKILFHIQQISSPLTDREQISNYFRVVLVEQLNTSIPI